MTHFGKEINSDRDCALQTSGLIAADRQNNWKTYEKEYIKEELAFLISESGSRASAATTTLNCEVCFAAGTPILMADGTTKSIEKIEVGDKVLVPHENAPEGELIESEITEVYHNPPSQVWHLEISDDNTGEVITIRATGNHPFYVPGKGWTEVANLEAGDRFISSNDEKHFSLKNKALEAIPVLVYNFKVKDQHTYFIGENNSRNILVHNANCKICESSNCTHYWHQVRNFAWDALAVAPYRIATGAIDSVKNSLDRVIHPAEHAKQELNDAAMLGANLAIIALDYCDDMAERQNNMKPHEYMLYIVQGGEANYLLKQGVVHGGNYLLDNPEETGALFGEIAVAIITDKGAGIALRLTSGSRLLRTGDKIDDIAKAVTKVDVTPNTPPNLISKIDVDAMGIRDGDSGLRSNFLERSDELLDIIRFTDSTEMSKKVANMKLDKLHILSKDEFLAKLGNVDDPDKIAAFHRKGEVYIRKDSQNKLSEIVHEGVHYVQYTDEVTILRIEKFSNGSPDLYFPKNGELTERRSP